MSISRKQLARILPPNPNGTHLSFLFNSEQWIVVQNGYSKIHILVDSVYKAVIQLEESIVSLTCVENDNHLQVLYYVYTGEWRILDISKALEIVSYSRNGGETILSSKSFGGVFFFNIPLSTQNSDEFPLYHLCSGKDSREWYGVDFFNRIYLLSLQKIESGWTLQSTLIFTHDSWKVTFLQFNSNHLYVGCEDRKIYCLSNQMPTVIGESPEGHAIAIINNSNYTYIQNEYNQVFVLNQSSPPISCQIFHSWGDYVFGLSDGSLMMIDGMMKQDLKITQCCQDIAILSLSSILLLLYDGRIVHCQIEGTFTQFISSECSLDPISTINQLECLSMQYTTLKQRNQEYVDYLCWKSKTEKELQSITLSLTAVSWESNDHSLLCRIEGIFPSSVTMLLLTLRSYANDVLSIQHPVTLQSQHHTFEIKPLYQPVLSSICTVTLFFVAFPNLANQLPVIHSYSLGSMSLVDLGIPFQSFNPVDGMFTLSLTYQLHSPSSLSHSMIESLLPSNPSQNFPVNYQLLQRGKSTMILLKGKDLETILLVRTRIHNRMIEMAKEKELWIVDLLREQEQIDSILDELKRMKINEDCETMDQLKQRVNLIQELININEKLSKMLL